MYTTANTNCIIQASLSYTNINDSPEARQGSVPCSRAQWWEEIPES